MMPTFTPMLPWPLLLLGGGAVWLLGMWLAWRGAAAAPKGARPWLVAVRGLALLVVLALLSNPGTWRTEGEAEPPGWAVLLDHSGSMATPDEGATSRWELARTFAGGLRQQSRYPERVQWRLFADALGEAWNPGDETAPDGEGTRLGQAGLTLLETAAVEGSRWTGLVVISDGRQTVDDSGMDTLATRARALGIPVHTVPLGTEVPRRDVEVKATRRQVVTLPNQAVIVPIRVINAGLEPVQVALRLLSEPSGKEAGSLKLAVSTGEAVSGEFTLPPGSAAGDYRVVMAPLPGDEHPGNDEDRFTLRILEKRTRVFLAEGAPYWDTKFLAQLLRDQGMLDVDAVYRIRPERFYRVASGEAAPLKETTDVFPETSAELGRYDLVVLGKASEAFLTGDRLERLRAFVRDQGGALLLSRGKPYSGDFDGFGLLEPGRWGEETGYDYTLLPTADGEESGLFGERLPHPGSAVWRGLAPLEDVRTLGELKPFTRVLAVGERVGGGSKVPLLVARRYGRGMVAAVNGDGLWRWGFHPGKKEDEDWHREFWMQLLQWAATYSEFLPGEDYSLQLSSSAIVSGGSVRARIGYRGGANPAPQPTLELSGADPAFIPAASAGTGEDGHPRWGVVLAPQAPGNYMVKLTAGGEDGPSAPFTVFPAPGEADEKSADRESLAKLAAATGGEVWSPADADQLLALLEPESAPVSLSEARWVPRWNLPWVLGVIAVLLGGEWLARRRLGLL